MCDKNRKENILKYKFWPFIQHIIEEKKFVLYEREGLDKDKLFDPNYIFDINHFYWAKKKERPITYASHMDSYVYSHYSYLLGISYEKFLQDGNLHKSIIAYRTVQISDQNTSGKNNIHFAMDSFEDIIGMKNCISIAFDVSGFFDSLDHSILKEGLIKILGGSTLEEDWFKIYRNLTKFSFLERDEIDSNDLIENIGKYNKKIDINKFNELKKIKKIIKTNPDEKGIPQGTPISGMLANLYMNKFDIIISDYISELGGKYYRYSDDILLIIPYNKVDNYLDVISKTSHFVLENIKDLKLEINNNKTEISVFLDGKIIKNVRFDKTSGKYLDKEEIIIKGFQYLGFIFDGNRVLLRNQTLTNYYKKLIQSLKRLYHLKDENKDGTNKYKTNKILLGKFNRKYLYNGVINGKKYKKDIKKNTWVIDEEKKGFYLGFLSYGYNAHELFSSFCKKYNIDNGIKKQLAGHKRIYNKFLIKFGIK